MQLKFLKIPQALACCGSTTVGNSLIEYCTIFSPISETSTADAIGLCVRLLLSFLFSLVPVGQFQANFQRNGGLGDIKLLLCIHTES